MLIQLHVENFAIVDNLTLEFDPDLNVLTGETGAGKSILIDAIRFVLGERIASARITSPNQSKKSIVEAVFEVPDAIRKSKDIFESVMNEDDDVLVLKREYDSNGKSRVWINQRVANASALKQLGEFLLDIHGQYDHQQIFDRKAHLEIVDRLAKNETLLKDYLEVFEHYKSLREKKREIEKAKEGREREIDLLEYQIHELESLKFKITEEEDLQTERIRLANSEKLYEFATDALKVLDENDVAVSPLLSRAIREIEGLNRLDETTTEFRTEFEDAQIKIEEVIRSLRNYQENLSFDPDRLLEIDARLDQLELIKRKYGGSLQAASVFLIEAKEKYDTLVNSEVYEKEAERELTRIKPNLEKFAKALKEKRKKTGQSLKKVIEGELKDLKIQDAKFEVRIEDSDFTSTGSDQLEFMMSLNAGQSLTELRKVASGGEASRVILAMKKALMRVDIIPTLIFDEIDANIGGRLGTVTGKKLKEIAEERQVLLVTHLPQIASFASRHFKVAKLQSKGKTKTDYRLLEGEARVQELSEMMSGQEDTDLSKAHAQEMLERVQS